MIYNKKLVIILAARFSDPDAKLIKEVAMARREDVSDFIRRAVRKELAILGYLNESDRKALGVTR